MKKTIGVLFVIALLLTFANSMFAQSFYSDSIVPCGTRGDLCTLCHFVVMAERIFRFLLAISFVTALLFVVIAGFLYITSAGSTQSLQNAKTAFRYALLGFLFCLLAWIFVNIIILALGYRPESGTWWRINLDCDSYYVNPGGPGGPGGPGQQDCPSCPGKTPETCTQTAVCRLNPSTNTCEADPSKCYSQQDCSKCSGFSADTCTSSGPCVVQDGQCKPDPAKCGGYNCEQCASLNTSNCVSDGGGNCKVSADGSRCIKDPTKCGGGCEQCESLAVAGCVADGGGFCKVSSDGTKCEKDPTKCGTPGNGYCAADYLAAQCSGGNTQGASCICTRESGGDPGALSGSDKCRNDPQRRSFSVGLFQINLTVHRINGLDCPSAFSARNYACSIVNESLYNQCVAAAQNPAINIAYACQLSNHWTNFRPWSTAGGCGL